MINYRKLKSQIHRQGIGHVTGYVFEPTTQQLDSSDWEIFPVQSDTSKRKFIRMLVCIIRDKGMNHWRKEFML